MAGQTLTGSSATDPTATPTLSAPAAGDALASAQVVAALQDLLDAAAWIRAKMARVDASNTFTATQIVQALLQLTANDLELTKAAAQKIVKTGGPLSVGTDDANDLDFIVDGTTLGTFRASDGRLGSLADPVADQDAVTKAWALAGSAWANNDANLLAAAGWTVNYAVLRRRWVGAGIALVYLGLDITAGPTAAVSVATVPNGYQGANHPYPALAAMDVTTGVPVAAHLEYGVANGTIKLAQAPTNGRLYRLTSTYLAFN